MKKVTALFVLAFLIFSLSIKAQEEKGRSPLFPKEGDFGASILIDGLIDNVNLSSVSNNYGQNILFAKYYLKDDLVARLGLGFTVNSASRETADSVGLSQIRTDSSASRFFINISGGIEKHLSGTKRLDPYVFSQLDLTFIGKQKLDINSSTSSKAGASRSERAIKADGGIAFGIAAGGGFNYFLAEKFSIGAELALQITYSSVGGTITDNQVITPINGSSTSTFISREDKLNQTDIGVSPQALINLSYFF